MGTVDVKVMERHQKTFWEKSYIPEIARGLGVTISQFFTNATSALNDGWAARPIPPRRKPS